MHPGNGGSGGARNALRVVVRVDVASPEVVPEYVGIVLQH